MLHKKSLKTIMLLLCAAVFSAAVFTACSGGDNKAENADSTTVQPAPDTSSSQTDTATLDTASTRPVKGPN